MSRIMIDDFCAPNYIKAIAHQFAYPRRTHTQILNYINPIFCANPKWSYSQETPDWVKVSIIYCYAIIGGRKGFADNIVCGKMYVILYLILSSKY